MIDLIMLIACRIKCDNSNNSGIKVLTICIKTLEMFLDSLLGNKIKVIFWIKITFNLINQKINNNKINSGNKLCIRRK